MKSNFVFLVFLSIFVGIDGQTCKESVGLITKKQLKGVTVCTGEMKFKNAKEKSARMTCVMKCVLLREGVLSEDGYADPVGALRFITSNLPAEVQEHSRKVMMACLDPAAKVQPDEFNCKSYDPLVKCALSSLNQFCNGPK